MAAKKKASKKKAVAKKAPAPVKIPKAVSTKVSKFLMMKANITAANKQLTEMKSEAFKLETELMGIMEKSNQLGIVVKSGSIKIKETETFNAKDWNKINAYIEDTGDFDIYQRRLNTTLLKDYFAAGKKIKGVEHFTKHSLGFSHKKN